MPEKKIDKTTPKAYRDLLGNDITWLRKKGFIAAIHPQIGITIKPKNSKSNDPDDFLYCFRYKGAVKAHGKKIADKIFQARIKFLRTHSTLRNKDLIAMDVECGIPNTHGASVGNFHNPTLTGIGCPFS